MDICTVRKSDGFMTVHTQTELRNAARKLTREHAPKGSRLTGFWVCADAAINETRLIAQYKQPDGYSSSIGKILS